MAGSERFFLRIPKGIRGQRGISILEQALVYPVLLGMVIAAVDISRILQGYSVLDQALRSTLRCVTPASGECHLADGVESEALFNVYQDDQPPRYRVQQHRYTAEAGWVVLPAHQLERLEATVIESVSYAEPVQSQVFGLDLFRPQGQVGYAIETSAFPRMDPGAGGVLEPRFLPEHGVAPRPVLSLISPAVSLRYRSSTSPGIRNQLSSRVRFTISPDMLYDSGASLPRAGERCFRASGSTGEADFTLPCDSLSRFEDRSVQQHIRAERRQLFGSDDSGREGAEYVFLVIDIRGHALTSEADSGAVALSVSQQGGRVRELGGRRLGASGTSNFVPRGAPPSSYRGSFLQRYPDEIREHQAIMVKTGVPVELEFTLKPDHAEVSQLEWSADRIEIYAPRYKGVLETAACGELASKERFRLAGNSACVGSRHPAGMPRLDTVVLPATPEQTLVEEICFSDSGGTAHEQLAARGINESGHYRHLGHRGSRSCPARQMTVPCAENRGSAHLMLAAGERSRRVCNDPEAARACGVPSGTETSFEGDICWMLGIRDIYPPQPLRWVQKDCSQQEPDRTMLPAEALGYPSLRLFSRPLQEDGEPLYTGGVDPEKFVSQHPHYQCPEIQTRKITIEPDLAVLKPESHFHATHALGAGFQDLLFHDAQVQFRNPARNLHPGVSFKAYEEVRTVVLNEEPGDPRQIFWLEPSESSERLIASRVGSNIVPEECLRPGARCRRELVQVLRQEGGSSKILAEAGHEAGYRAVQAAMPGIARECQQKDQSCVSLSLDDERDERGRIFTVEGELRVPLIMSPSPFVLSRVARGRWERDLISRPAG